MDERLDGSSDRNGLTRLLDKVRQEHGLDLSQYRIRYVERRLATRLRVLGLDTYRQYALHLDADPGEYERLRDALTISVTQFFRDESVFAAFRSEVVPALMARKDARRQGTVRVWSAGCATGEEPYSIAMSFLSQMRSSESAMGLIVVGTDVDRSALASARQAVYPVARLEQVPEPERSRYTRVSGDTFQITPEVTQHVRFRYLNLFEDEPVRMADVIFCRNVFIYRTRAEQERLLNVFRDSMPRGGYLVLGRSERLAPSLGSRFELVNGRERIYRKRDD